MKKRILLIGNSDGLAGVKVDLENYRNFFTSNIGGAWYNSEITELLNPSKIAVTREIDNLKSQKLDYSIIIFSGHGGQKRETVLELNKSGECIGESAFDNIADRQLMIFDCCRAVSQITNEARVFSEVLNKALSNLNVRERFEQRIMQAIHQQAKLYSCSIGELSYDDATNGGIYTQNLIKASKNLLSDFKLVGEAHEEARISTTAAKPSQHPDSILPRCLSSQQLIIGIKP